MNDDAAPDPTPDATPAPRRWALRAVLALTLVAIGVGLGAAVVRPPLPEALGGDAAPATVAVGREAFDDAISASVEIVVGTDVPLAAGAAGRLTASSCVPGAVIESGTSAFSVDGAPLLSLHTSVPLYRPLAVGDRGDDVRALQDELARLGAGITSDGVLGAASLRALAALFADVGDPVRAAELPWDRLLWQPLPSIVVTACDAPLGATVEAGAPIATAAGSPVSALVTPSTAPEIAGDRVLDLAGTDIGAVDERGTLDAEGLAALARSPSYRLAEVVDGRATVQASLRLRDSVEVGIVPPSALVGIDGNRACVIADGAPVPVTIVGSRLGQTFVDAGEALPATVATAPDPLSACP